MSTPQSPFSNDHIERLKNKYPSLRSMEGIPHQQWLEMVNWAAAAEHYDDQHSLLEVEKGYAKSIRTATVVIAIATAIYTIFTILSYFKPTPESSMQPQSQQIQQQLQGPALKH